MQQYSAEEKAKWLESWKGSGKSIWAFAAENGIKGQTFSKWVKKEAIGKQAFVEIRGEKAAPGPFGILIEKSGIKIYLPLGMRGNEIRAVMEGAGFLP
jgi:hypothetical protein